MAGAPNPFLAGLRGRCPNCDEGPLFEGFLKVSPRCEACGFDLSRADSGDGPAVFVILIGGCLGAFGALFTMFATRSALLSLVIWIPGTLFICLALMRPTKGLLLASQFKNKASESRHV